MRLILALLGLFAFVQPAHAQQQISCANSVIYNASTNGATQLVPALTNARIYLCGYTFWANGVVTVSLVSGTGTNCATGTVTLVPAFVFSAASQGITDGSGNFRGLATAAGQALCLNTSAGVAVQAIIYFTQY
jgi:hypothetical protein